MRNYWLLHKKLDEFAKTHQVWNTEQDSLQQLWQKLALAFEDENTGGWALFGFNRVSSMIEIIEMVLSFRSPDIKDWATGKNAVIWKYNRY
jgi:hypothetical protein